MEVEKFSTGAQRNSAAGRGAFELLPARTIRLLAEHFENGAIAHGGRNWEKGINLSRYVQSALRHSFDYLEGKDSEDHALSAFWNWACLIETRERIKAGLLPKELDDMSDLPSWQKPKYPSEKVMEFIKKEQDDFKREAARDFAAVDDKFLKAAQICRYTSGIKYDKIPTLEKKDVKDFNQWIDSKKFRPALMNVSYHGAAHHIEYKSHSKNIGRCFSTDFQRGVFEPIFWRYIQVENTDGSFIPTYFKPTNNVKPQAAVYVSGSNTCLLETGQIVGINSKGEVSPIYNPNEERPIPERLAAIDKEIEDRGLFKDQNPKIDKLSFALIGENIQILEWNTDFFNIDFNRLLICEYRIEELQRFNPNFPVAKYALAFANTLDKSLFKRWAYMEPKVSIPKTFTNQEIKDLTPKHVLPPKKDNPESYYRWRDTIEETPQPSYVLRDVEIINFNEEVERINLHIRSKMNFRFWRYIRE